MPGKFDAAVLRWDVVAYLRRKGLETGFTETNQARIRCPLCSDRKLRLYIDQRKKLWLCFNCNEKGSAVTLIQAIEHCDDVTAMNIILSTVPQRLRQSFDQDEDSTPAVISLPSEYRRLELPVTDKSRPFWEYLDGRGLARSLVMDYEMGYCRVGRYKRRVIIPVLMQGELRGWVARAITSKQKIPYLNEASVKTSKLLFNLDKVTGHEEVVLVEGVFDALRLSERAVCTFGKKISREQMEALDDAGFRKWIFCYDGDAVDDGLKFAARVPEYIDTYVARLPREYDPGNAPMLVLQKAIREAVPWVAGRSM